MKLIGELEIVEKAAVPAQQTRVLAPQHRLSDGKFTHDLSGVAVIETPSGCCGRIDAQASPSYRAALSPRREEGVPPSLPRPLCINSTGSLLVVDDGARAPTSMHRRFRRKRGAAHAHAAARVLPQLLGRMQVAERAGDGAEVVRREALGNVGVVARLLGDRLQ